VIREIQSFFPQLKFEINGKRLVYLDSAATALKPLPVIERVAKHLEFGAANVHRGAHHLSDVATDEFEKVREEVAQFINAEKASEIIFTQGSTHGLNLIAYSLARKIVKEGDEILVSQMEHHSNIVPWQMIAKENGATVKFTKVKEDGSLDAESFRSLLTSKTKIVSLVQLSNAIGTWNDLKPLLKEAKKAGAYTVVDAAQSITSRPVDVRDLDCDFLVFSGHKIFGPTGIGVLYGRETILREMPPFFGGGSMIGTVSEQEVTFLQPPHRFEAGTPAIAEVFGLGAALRFFKQFDRGALREHDAKILKYAQDEIEKFSGVQVLGRTLDRSHVLSFNMEGAHPSDIGTMLNEEAVAVRTGHHCCMPLMTRFQIPGTVRASFQMYSDEEDVARFVSALKKVKGLLL
jgi:cysteine desulfurase / selenocysteine lyase